MRRVLGLFLWLALGGCSAPVAEPPAPRVALEYPGLAHPERALPQSDEDIVRWSARMATTGWSGSLSSWVLRGLERESSPACPLPVEPRQPDGFPQAAPTYIGDGCTSWGASSWFGTVTRYREGEIPSAGEEGEPPIPYRFVEHIAAAGFGLVHPEPSRSSAPELLALDGTLHIDDEQDEAGCRMRQTSVDMEVWVYDERDRLAQRLPSMPVSVWSEASYSDCGQSVGLEGSLAVAEAEVGLTWQHTISRERCPFEPLEGEVEVTWGGGSPERRSPQSSYRLVFDGENTCDECIDWYRDGTYMGQLCSF